MLLVKEGDSGVGEAVSSCSLNNDEGLETSKIKPHSTTQDRKIMQILYKYCIYKVL